MKQRHHKKTRKRKHRDKKKSRSIRRPKAGVMITILEDPLQTQVIYEDPQVIEKKVEKILKRHDRQTQQKTLKRRLAQQHRNRSRLLATAANERLMREQAIHDHLRRYKKEDSSPKKKSPPRRSRSRSPQHRSQTRRIWDKLTRGIRSLGRSRRTKKK